MTKQIFLRVVAGIIGSSLTLLAAQTSPDPIADYWSKKPKFFILIAVDKSTVPNTDLEFAVADAGAITKLFKDAGYQPLGPQPMVGVHANAQEIEGVLDLVRQQAPEASVVIYYSGHAAIDSMGKDLWLQLYGQKQFGALHGLRFSTVLLGARGQNDYEGELTVIIDSCFSGASSSVNSVTLDLLGSSTVILASSSKKEESQKIALDNGKEMSAFSYSLVRATTDDRDSVDSGDGFITYEELEIFSTNALRDWYKAQRLNGEMHPKRWANVPAFFDYAPARVKKPDSPYRQYVLGQLLAEQLEIGDTPYRVAADASIGVGKTMVSPNALRTAQAISESAPPYARALKAVVLGKPIEESSLPLPANESEKLTLARLLFAAGKHSKAMDLYSELLVAEPNNRVVQREAGVTAIFAGQFDFSETTMKQMVALDSRKTQTDRRTLGADLNNLGTLYFLRGKLSAAQSAFKKADSQFSVSAESDLDTATTSANLAEVYRTKGNYDQAVDAYQKSIDLRKAQGEVDLNLAADMEKYATVLANQNRIDAARTMKSEAESIRQTNPK